jgi:hypothetical protein
MSMTLPTQMGYLREQIAVCLVAAKLGTRFIDLPISHAYPIQNYRRYMRRGWLPEQAALWHYQLSLGKFFRTFATSIDGLLSVDEKIACASQAAEDLRNNYARLLGRDESFLRSLRRRYRIGPRIRTLIGVDS